LPVEYFAHDSDAAPVRVQLSRFRGGSGVDEYHLLACPTAPASDETQLAWLEQAYARELAALELQRGSGLWRRFFLADVASQVSLLGDRPFSDPHTAEARCAVSCVGQAPPPPARIAMWAYHVDVPEGVWRKHLDGSTLVWQRDGLSHMWTTGMVCLRSGSPHDQTLGVFEQYEAALRARGLSLAQDVIRTWLFVRDIDAHYEGVVTARRALFQQRGLTPQTHYISSTGIEGAGAEAAALVTMDAHAVAGVQPAQIAFLSAPQHLCPTHRYGVTFERGTTVSYRDRSHVVISGTASIDKEGKIVHEGDVLRQLDRALDNVEALLARGGATLRDVCLLVVYVRDPDDRVAVRRRLRKRCGPVPFEVVAARVCRPGWLVEVECQAVVAAENPDLPSF
jgi:enamine deaminase RidA (YjgF/YER057c/UK114 family)